MAEEHHRLALQKKCLLAWFHRSQESLARKMAQAEEFCSRMLLRRVFWSWLWVRKQGWGLSVHHSSSGPWRRTGWKPKHPWPLRLLSRTMVSPSHCFDMNLKMSSQFSVSSSHMIYKSVKHNVQGYFTKFMKNGIKDAYLAVNNFEFQARFLCNTHIHDLCEELSHHCISFCSVLISYHSVEVV